MIRRLTLAWPASKVGVGGRPARFLAVSDERVRSLEDARNRAALAPIDAVLGCGDLDPDYLAFLADAFHAPLLFVRGNHDRGGAWHAGQHHLPRPLEGRRERIGGVPLIGLSWPGPHQGRAIRDELAAWLQAFGAAWQAGGSLPGWRPHVVLSHVPPSGLGDAPADPYHRGFAGYRWLCRSLRPPLWLHGHTTSAAVASWRTQSGPTMLVNVTGAVFIELVGANEAAGGGNIARPADPAASSAPTRGDR